MFQSSFQKFLMRKLLRREKILHTPLTKYVKFGKYIERERCVLTKIHARIVLEMFKALARIGSNKCGSVLAPINLWSGWLTGSKEN